MAKHSILSKMNARRIACAFEENRSIEQLIQSAEHHALECEVALYRAAEKLEIPFCPDYNPKLGGLGKSTPKEYENVGISLDRVLEFLSQKNLSTKLAKIVRS